MVVLGAILGYPIYNLIRLSLQQYGLFELLQHHGVPVGLRNFSSILHDQISVSYTHLTLPTTPYV